MHLSPQPSARRLLLARLTLALLVAALYAVASVRNDFIYDDQVYIVQAQPVRTLGDVLDTFRSPNPGELPYYRPVVMLSLWVQKAIHGNDPAPYHLFNAALAGLIVLAASSLLLHTRLRVPPPLALLAAVLLALHPAASSCVYPADSGRETLLPALCMILALDAFLRPGRLRYAWSLVALTLALFGKEQAVMLPVIFAAAECLGLSDRSPARRWLRLAPAFALLGFYLLMRHRFFAGADITVVIQSQPSAPVWAALYAIQTAFLPTAAFAYEPPLTTWLSWPRLLLASTALLALIIALTRAETPRFPGAGTPSSRSSASSRWRAAFHRGRHQDDPVPNLPLSAAGAGTPPSRSSASSRWRAAFHRGRHQDDPVQTLPLSATGAGTPSSRSSSPSRLLLFWALWWLLSLAPTAGFIRQEVAFDERYIFVSLLAIVAIAALAAATRWDRPRVRRTALVIGAAAALVFLVISLHRAKTFATPAAYYTQWLRTNPTSPQALHGVAQTHLRAGRTDEAIALLTTATRLSPAYANAHNTLAQAYAARRQFDHATEAYQSALAADPSHLEALNNLAVLQAQLGRPAEALPLLRTALAAHPTSAQTFSNLGGVMIALRRLDRATRAYARAVQLDPALLEAQAGLGGACAAQGDFTNARVHLRIALDLATAQHRDAEAAVLRNRLARLP